MIPLGFVLMDPQLIEELAKHDKRVRWAEAFDRIGRNVIPPPADLVSLQQLYGMYADGVHPFVIKAAPFGAPVRGGQVCMIRRGAGGAMPAYPPSFMPVPQNSATVGQGLVNPVLAHLLSTRTQPTFSGDPGDWERFSPEWVRYEAILRQGQGEDVPDAVMLAIFRLSLDVASVNKLDAALRENPQLTFKAFWDDLVREFSYDPTGHYRREWSKVVLHISGRDMTLSEWRNYWSALELAGGRIDDLSEREKWERLMHDLPGYMRVKVFNENARRMRDSHWLKVAKPIPLTKDELIDVYGRCADLVVKVEETVTEFLVNCGSSAARDVVLGMNGWDPLGDGCPLVFQQHNRRMTSKEVNKWVTDELRVQQELQSYAPVVQSRVNAVVDQPQRPPQAAQNAAQAHSGPSGGGWRPNYGRDRYRSNNYRDNYNNRRGDYRNRTLEAERPEVIGARSQAPAAATGVVSNAPQVQHSKPRESFLWVSVGPAVGLIGLRSMIIALINTR